MVGLPSFPDYLPDEARSLWDAIGSELVRNGVMTELDAAALADLVETELLNRRLSKDIQTEPATLSTERKAEDGTVQVDAKKNPLWALKLDYLRERRAQYQQFGMTPASRSKIIALATEEDDPIEAALH